MAFQGLHKWHASIRGRSATRSCRRVADWAAGVAVAGLVWLSSSAAVADVPIELVGQWGGPSQAIAVSGEYAYLGVGHRMVILDVTDPANPQVIARTEPLPSLVSGIAVAGEHAYVTDNWAGLTVFDITDPAAPSPRGFCDTYGMTRDIFVVGDHAYVADGDHGLVIINIADPDAPFVQQAYDTDGEAYSVVVVGDLAYVADGAAGLQVVDVSDPDNPSGRGLLDFPDEARGIDVVGDYAYVACSFSGGFRVVNVSDPDNLAEVGSCLSNAAPFDVVVEGNLAYVADAWAGFAVVDVTDPETPFVTASQFTGGWCNKLAVAGGYAYLADYNQGLNVMELSQPSGSMWIGGYQDLCTEATDLAVDGSYLYVSDGGFGAGLKVIDVFDPANPQRLGSTTTHEFAWGMTLDNGHVYLADGCAGLGVIDVGDPFSPQRISNASTGCAARDVVVQDDIAYIADDHKALVIVDVSNPYLPLPRGQWQDPDHPGYALGIAVAGDYAYVANAEVGLEIVDVTDLDSPVGVGRYDTDGSARDVAVRDGYAYVADDWMGLQIIDVSDPENPVWVSRCSAFSAANGVTLVGDYAYVAAMDWGVQVVDVSDPTDPQRVGEYNTTGLARRVAVAMPYLYVAELDGGLTILRIVGDTGEDFLWNDPSDGLFGDPDRWTPSGPPGASDRAVFDLPGMYTVSFDADTTTDRLLVNQGDVNFDLFGWQYSLAHGWDGTPSVAIADRFDDTADARLTVRNGRIEAHDLEVGRWAENIGELTVDLDAHWNAPDSFCSIGVEGTGTVTVTDGSSMEHGHGWLGWAPSGWGHLTVKDSYSEWNTSYGFTVGRAGVGEMTVQGSASAFMGQCVLGELDSGDGTLTVDDFGSCDLTDSDGDSLTIGRAGRGAVVVQYDAGLTNAGRLRIAELGGSYGRLSIEWGGGVDVDGQMAVGCVADATGEVEVALGGRLDVHNHLLIGGDAAINNGGTGSFGVGEDGYVSAEHVRVGDAAGATGELTVLGPNALLEVGPTLSPENHSQLEIGPRGYGSVTVEAGGKIEIYDYPDGYSGLTILAGGSGVGEGHLTVAGLDSTFISGAQIQVGRRGFGEMRVADQATVYSHKASSGTGSSGILGMEAAGNGTVTVTDPDSLWTQDGVLNVGWTTRGQLLIENGARVESAEGVIARLPGSTGAVTIRNASSAWEIDTSLSVGGLFDAAGGTGAVSVEDHATLSTGGMLRVWPGSTLNLADGDITPGDSMWLSGTLSGSGTINGHVENDGGLVSPGTSTGLIAIDGDYTQDDGGALHIQIGGLVPGDDFDRLEIAGWAVWGGLLDVSFVDDFVPEIGDRFDIVTFGDVFLGFDTVHLPDSPDGVSYCVTMLGNAVVFLATPPADFTCDGFVDLDDFWFFSYCLGSPSVETTPGCEQADLTGDGHVDLADIAEFQRAFTGPQP